MTDTPLPAFPCAAEPYLPHAAPMALVDQIIRHESGQLESAVHIGDQHLFMTEAGVPVWVAVEFMAQSIAAYAGVQAVRRGEPVRIGFLVSTRQMNCAVDFFERGSDLRVFVREVVMAENGLATFDCSVQLQGRDCVSARINVFQPADPDAFLRSGVMA